MDYTGNKKHILFIVENNSVPHDQRVWKEALAAKQYGFKVSIICPITKIDYKIFQKVNGINIYRHYFPIEASKKYAFFLEYGISLFFEIILSLKIFVKDRFHVIHSANPPDHIFLLALFYRCFGVKYIFDHHDICPENYIAKFHKKDIFYRLLLFMEKCSFLSADLVISTNESYKSIAINRGKVKEENIFVVRNGPDLENIPHTIQNPERWKQNYKYLVSYVGIMGNQEGIDCLLRMIHYISYRKKIKNIKFILIGKGPHRNELIKLSMKLKVDNIVHFTGYVPYSDFYEILATSDLCVNPEFQNEFTDRSTMIKIMDYMSFGRPIIQFYTKEGYITAKNASAYIKNNDEEEFADKLLELLINENIRNKMGEEGRIRIKTKLNWSIQKRNLFRAYERLFLQQNRKLNK